MNPKNSERWKSQVLDEIFIALAASEPLDQALIYKGARVLNVHLPETGRQSLDLDSNLAGPFVQAFPDREAQRVFLEDEMKVNDLSKNVRTLPVLEIDVAAPEELLETSVAPIEVGGHHVYAYMLERIAGEKLRAFLSSLPAYRAKVNKPGEAVRAKDLYDVSRIRAARGLEQVEFWRLAGEEFRVACQSRYIDCQGLTTFQEQWAVTQKTYEEATIPKDISFEEAEATLVAVVSFLETRGIVPFTFPLPEGSAR